MFHKGNDGRMKMRCFRWFTVSERTVVEEKKSRKTGLKWLKYQWWMKRETLKPNTKLLFFMVSVTFNFGKMFKILDFQQLCLNMRKNKAFVLQSEIYLDACSQWVGDICRAGCCKLPRLWTSSLTQTPTQVGTIKKERRFFFIKPTFFFTNRNIWFS